MLREIKQKLLYNRVLINLDAIANFSASPSAPLPRATARNHSKILLEIVETWIYEALRTCTIATRIRVDGVWGEANFPASEKIFV